MRVRMEIDKTNGKAYTTDIDDKYYDVLHDFLYHLYIITVQQKSDV